MIRLQAPAKINLFLEITGRRPDGYHTLSTLFQTISLADEITFKAAPVLKLTCTDSSLPADESNLVLRAARRLKEALGEERGAAIRLVKRVPMGAGLGGGSSDAATTLLGLCRLWNRRLPSSALHRLAVSLGADVPFFLKKGTCLATGIGDRLRPVQRLRKSWLVLVYPGFGVPTKAAYAKAHLPFEHPRKISTLRASWLKPEHLFNRFEELVFPDHPALPALKRRLLDLGATAAMMSGSGSSVFGLVPGPLVGRRVLRALRDSYPEAWLVHTL